MIKTLIDDNYIEDIQEGLITLRVSGREYMEIDVDANENISDGSRVTKKRIPSRNISVMVHVKKCVIDKKDIIQKIRAFLGKEMHKISFSDDPGVYYEGVCTSVSILKENINAANISLTFYCSMPYKYSIETKEVNATVSDGVQKTAIVNYGSVPVPIDYEIKMKSDNGFIGIVSETDALLFGSVEEEDLTNSCTLLNLSGGTDVILKMSPGNAVLTEPFSQNGTFKKVTASGKEYIAIDSLGSNASNTAWYGAGGKITLPADTNGVRGAENFRLTFKPWFETYLVSAQTGIMEIVVADNDNNLICDAHIVKWSSANTTDYYMKVGRQDKKIITYTPSWQGETNEASGECYIEKDGGLFTFNFAGNNYTFRDDTLEDVKAMSVSIYLGQMRGRDLSHNQAVTFNRIGMIRFEKIGQQGEFDRANTYKNGDVVYIDGSTGKYYVNGSYRPEDEADGSEYFMANPGTTNVQFTCSDYATAPEIKAIIREAWL